MKASVIIQNLKCGGCVNTITSKLSSIEGVENVEVVIEDSKVNFDCISNDILETAKDTLIKLGYPEEGTSNSVVKKAKSYVSCAIGKIS